MKENELVSVILPCYNVGEFLKEGLESILNQSYKNLEIVCLNDCSTDDTLVLLEEYAKKDDRVVVYSNDVNKGLIYTLNRLVQLASCDIIVRMDPDDISEKERISNLVDRLIQDDADLVSSDYSWIDDKSNFLKKKGFDLLSSQLGIKYTAIYNSPFPHPQSIFRKRIFVNEKYDSNYKAAEDYKLWTCLLLSEKFKGVIINKELYRYRINESGMSISNAELQAENHILIAKNYTEKLLNVSTQGYHFWSIAKKTYQFESYQDINLQLRLVADLRKKFIIKFKPAKNELDEIDSYTFQYLIYLYKNIWEMSKKDSFPRKMAVKSIFRSVTKTLNLFNLRNIKWIVRNM